MSYAQRGKQPYKQPDAFQLFCLVTSKVKKLLKFSISVYELTHLVPVYLVFIILPLCSANCYPGYPPHKSQADSASLMHCHRPESALPNPTMQILTIFFGIWYGILTLTKITNLGVYNYNGDIVGKLLNVCYQFR